MENQTDPVFTTKRFDAKSGMVLDFDQYNAIMGDDGIGGYKNNLEWRELPIVTNWYDSEADTRRHIARVSELMMAHAAELLQRAASHDDSKLSDAEKPYFDREGPTLKRMVLGSDGYREALERLKPAIENHYRINSHHPQYYDNGILGMDLFDLLEMICNWKAAGERDATTGGLLRSIDINAERFEIPDALVQILQNHALRWLPHDPEGFMPSTIQVIASNNE